MTNKENMKKIIKNNYDKKNNYTAIVEKMESKNKKINLYKYSAIPVCMVVIISLVCIFNANQNNLKSKDEKNANTNHFTTSSSENNIIINDISKEPEESYDMDYKIQNGVYIPYFEVLSNLNIPKDFDNNENARSIWVKSNASSNEYDILNHYEFYFKNTKNNREIIISFSDKYQPLRRCVKVFVGDYPKSTINGIEIPIFKGNKNYISIFSYNGYNFDIEGIDITEEEFINLLESLIK